VSPTPETPQPGDLVLGELVPGELVLLRHGATEWSASGKHTGRTDVPLSDQGERQAKLVGPLIAERTIVAVFASPLIRARRTAELAGLGDIGIDADLQEWDYGGYEGLTTAQISHDRPGWSLWRDGVVAHADGRPGETAADVGVRADRVIARTLPALRSGDVALVSHGHFLRVLAARWLGLAATGGALLALDTASVSVLGFERADRVVRRWNLVPAS
jgi:broad specificity phosphatase PhoE